MSDGGRTARPPLGAPALPGHGGTGIADCTNGPHGLRHDVGAPRLRGGKRPARLWAWLRQGGIVSFDSVPVFFGCFRRAALDREGSRCRRFCCRKPQRWSTSCRQGNIPPFGTFFLNMFSFGSIT